MEIAAESGGSRDENQLRKLASAVHELADTVNSTEPHIKISHFAAALHLTLITKLGFGRAFFVAYIEIKSKVKELVKRTNPDDTIQSVLQREMSKGTERRDMSASRNIVRLKRVIEAAMVVLEQVLSLGPESFPEALCVAYGQVFAPFHGPSSRETFSVLKPLFPTLTRALAVLGEEGNSWREPCTKYIAASRIVIDHIESVFNSNERSARLLGLI